MTDQLSYNISEEDQDFYEWRQEAQKNGLLHDATLAYYLSDSKHLYTIVVDGDLETAPIFTYRKWLAADADFDKPIEGVSEEPIREEFDDGVIREMVEAIAYNDDSLDGDIEDYVWNGPVYAAINATTDTMNFRLVESDYFTVKNSAVKLKNELYKSLYERGVEPDAPYLDVVDHINEIDTPLRDKYYRTFEQVLQFRDGPRLAGSSAVTVFNTGDDYVIPIATRSSKVSESAGWKNPLPAGVLQPPEGEGKELSTVKSENLTVLQEHILDEFRGAFLDDSSAERGLMELHRMIENEDAHMMYTSAGIDCKQTYVQFYGMIMIDDPEYYQKYIEGEDLGGWESESVEMVSVSDEEKIKELLDRHVMNPYNLLGFSEALFTLRDVFDVELPIELSRT